MLEVAVAVLTRFPDVMVTFTTIVTVAEPPTAMVPRLAVTVPLVPEGGPLQLPGEAVHEMKVTPAGSGSLSMTATAASGPRLVICTM